MSSDIDIDIDLSPFSEEELKRFFKENVISKSELLNELSNRKKKEAQEQLRKLIMGSRDEYQRNDKF